MIATPQLLSQDQPQVFCSAWKTSGCCFASTARDLQVQSDSSDVGDRSSDSDSESDYQDTDEDEGIPDSVRMILIMNPISRHNDTYGDPITKPLPDFEHFTLTTPYRSTIAITKLARFIIECEEVALPDEDYGSDVQGIKPIFFDVGGDQRKMQEALEHCHSCFGDDVTILYDDSVEALSDIFKIVMKKGKEQGGPWKCYNTNIFSKQVTELVNISYFSCLCFDSRRCPKKSTISFVLF